MLPLFIVENIPDRGDLVIEGEEAHHAGSVARIKVGERVSVTNGLGRRAEVEVLDINKRNIGCRIIDVSDEPRAKTILTVIQALTKGDRARETIELLTEGGADIIIPWSASRSIGQWKEDKDSLAKWRSWAREATKQSRRNWIPEVLDVQTTSQIKQRIEDSEFALMLHESGENKFSELARGKAPKEVLLIIGPEGGISEDEAAGFVQAGANSVVLGKPVFRSAHAGVAALSAVQAGFGIW
ncbi:MAG: 16S rRNA (uracil(1498)-N(3))-methyltransferase [Candidatus Nanopelagicaceae bacterium]